MKRWRWLLAVVVIGLVVAAAYVAGTSQPDAGPAKPNEADAATYAYEAHDVVLRQMDRSGALQYEIEAASVTQLPRKYASSHSCHRPPRTVTDDARSLNPLSLRLDTLEDAR